MSNQYVHLIVLLVVIAVLLGLLNRYCSEWLDGTILKLINVVAVIGCVVLILVTLLPGILR